MLQHVSAPCSFLGNNVLLHTLRCVCSFISGWPVGCFHLLAITNIYAFLYKVRCRCVFFALRYIAESHMIIGEVCINHSRNCQTIFQSSYTIDIYISSVWGLEFLHFLVNTYYLTLIIAILVDMKWYLLWF